MAPESGNRKIRDWGFLCATPAPPTTPTAPPPRTAIAVGPTPTPTTTPPTPPPKPRTGSRSGGSRIRRHPLTAPTSIRERGEHHEPRRRHATPGRADHARRRRHRNHRPRLRTLGVHMREHAAQ
ncbi:hypothetical protein CFP75_34300 [Amycolatopsis alba DSM 44262]|uniref:Uncharacterized protein n=1 Tax=Amycolatopsis alba DSM 44262 TaxID=1125972 RepID=A0A229RCU8_AMYAL|nr:hypothetical protein CFP75_34300 [Amycolatopsis alba DSM 44262]